MKYDIAVVDAWTLLEATNRLVKKVNQACAEGWMPSGSPIFDSYSNGDSTRSVNLAQALIKLDDNDYAKAVKLAVDSQEKLTVE